MSTWGTLMAMRIGDHAPWRLKPTYVHAMGKAGPGGRVPPRLPDDPRVPLRSGESGTRVRGGGAGQASLLVGREAPPGRGQSPDPGCRVAEPADPEPPPRGPPP